MSKEIGTMRGCSAQVASQRQERTCGYINSVRAEGESLDYIRAVAMQKSGLFELKHLDKS